MTECAHCGSSITDTPVTTSEGQGQYCCSGCLAMAREESTAAGGSGPAGRGPVDPGGSDVEQATAADPGHSRTASEDTAVAADPDHSRADSGEGPGAVDPDDVERAGSAGATPIASPAPGNGRTEDAETVYLGVSGMHCATCETFIEERAAEAEGLHAAEASYPAGVVKLTYDPALTDVETLGALLDGLGYETSDVATDEAATGEDAGRLLVGALFGMMVMAWYVVVLYPTYLGVGAAGLLVDVTGPAGLYVLGNVWVMATVVLAYTGFPLLRGAYVSLRARSPNMDLLVSLAAVTAYLYSVLVLARGGTEVYFDVSVVIVLAVTVGNYYEDRVRRRAAGRLATLTEERVDRARRRTADGTETVPIDALSPGDRVVVRTGERVPVDGTVLDGEASVDRSLVTGESVPERVEPGDSALGGTRVVEGGFVLAVDPGAGSTLDRLTDLLWDVSAGQSGVQGLADRIARVFVPLVVVLALAATAVHLVAGTALAPAVLTGLAVLVVSCPCALGLATPLAVAAGVSRGLAEGIVVTEGSVFERATEADVVVFDKTGTLTTGRMRVLETVGEDLAYAAAVEQFSDHPVAGAVVEAVGRPDLAVEDVESHPGRGVSATVAGSPVVVGRAGLLRDRGVSVRPDLAARAEAANEAGRVPVLVGVDGEATGLLVAGDEPRSGWEDVLGALGADRRVVVLTGDSAAAASHFAASPVVDEVRADVAPEEKTAVVEDLRATGTVAMVGDGSNDAPALAAADVGIALAEGTQLAATAADVVVVSDDLAAVPRVFELTTLTRGRIRENLGWAFLYNAVALPLALVGLVNPLFAAVAMATSSLLVVGNSARSLG